MITKKVLLLLIICFEVLSQFLWRSCQNFKFISGFSSYDISLKLEDTIHNDTNMSFIIIRFFHNKITLTLSEILKQYLLLWDFRLIIDLVSFIGLVGVIFSFWYIFAEKKKTIRIAFITLVIAPVIIVFLPGGAFAASKLLLSAIFFVLSLYGWIRFLQPKKISTTRLIVLLVAFLISFFYYSANLDTTAYFCLK